jgi:pilus assembly protein Flp/PilA
MQFDRANYAGGLHALEEVPRYGWPCQFVHAPGRRQGTSKNPREQEMRRIIVSFINDQAGATAIEYGLIAAGISIAIIVAVNGIGGTLNTTFTGVNTQLR